MDAPLVPVATDTEIVDYLETVWARCADGPSQDGARYFREMQIYAVRNADERPPLFRELLTKIRHEGLGASPTLANRGNLHHPPA